VSKLLLYIKNCVFHKGHFWKLSTKAEARFVNKAPEPYLSSRLIPLPNSNRLTRALPPPTLTQERKNFAVDFFPIFPSILLETVSLQSLQPCIRQLLLLTANEQWENHIKSLNLHPPQYCSAGKFVSFWRLYFLIRYAQLTMGLQMDTIPGHNFSCHNSHFKFLKYSLLMDKIANISKCYQLNQNLHLLITDRCYLWP
jgi:hypothetical protein